MSVFKCKMCGGNLNPEAGQRVCTCEFCGSAQAIPGIHSDRIEGMFERANQFRINYEFDKALSIYELILEEENGDADLYWSIFLCKYGVNYIEDGLSGKRIPTINRFQFTSVYADVDYKACIEHATEEQKAVYEEEVKRIAEIQKTFMEISEKEDPFDVFICYKETDEMGRRAVDSVLANDIYHALDQKGIKTFFSRITLEDKLGVDYEPYIFSALNSAKIMVVLGTKPEFFQAIWVKNEWARFISMINNGAEKTLIPAFKGMDPYALPAEFAHLQALDMSKLGFMQDLIRGIEKILGKDKVDNNSQQKEPAVQSVSGVQGVKQMAKNFLIVDSFDKAYDLYEQVLDNNCEDIDAYLGEIFVSYNVKSFDELERKLINKVDDIIKERELSASYVCENRSYEIANKYAVKGYYSKEDIMKVLNFNLIYEQKIDDIALYIEDVKKLRQNSFKYYYLFANDEEKQTMDNLIDNVLEALNNAYEVRKKYEEELIANRTKLYNEFIDSKLKDITSRSEKAKILRDSDYDKYSSLVRKSISSDNLRNAIYNLEKMGGYRECYTLISLASEKIQKIETSKEVVSDVVSTFLKIDKY